MKGQLRRQSVDFLEQEQEQEKGETDDPDDIRMVIWNVGPTKFHHLELIRREKLLVFNYAVQQQQIGDQEYLILNPSRELYIFLHKISPPLTPGLGIASMRPAHAV